MGEVGELLIAAKLVELGFDVYWAANQNSHAFDLVSHFRRDRPLPRQEGRAKRFSTLAISFLGLIMVTSGCLSPKLERRETIRYGQRKGHDLTYELRVRLRVTLGEWKMLVQNMCGLAAESTNLFVSIDNQLLDMSSYIYRA